MSLDNRYFRTYEHGGKSHLTLRTAWRNKLHQLALLNGCSMSEMVEILVDDAIDDLPPAQYVKFNQDNL